MTHAGDLALSVHDDNRHALEAFGKSYDIFEHLVGIGKSNAGWQRDLIVSNVKLAWMGDEPVRRYGWRWRLPVN